MPTQVEWADTSRRWSKTATTTTAAAMTSVRSLLRNLSGGIIGIIRGRRIISRKRNMDAHTSTEFGTVESATDDHEPCVDVDDWLVGTLMELDEAASRTTPPVSVSRCIDDVDGSRYIDEDDGLVLTDAEREAGKSTIYEEDTEDPGGPLPSSLKFDPFDPMPPSLQMRQNALLFKCASDKPSGALLGGAGKRGRSPSDKGKGAMSPAEKQERYVAHKREEAAPKRKEARLSKKIEEEEQDIQKQNRQRLAQAKEKEIFGMRVVQSAREEANRRREEHDEFYRRRQEKALEEVRPPEPKRSKHYAEANRKRAEREQEVDRRREEQDEFYRRRQEKALEEVHPPEPRRSKRNAEANRKRAEREQESEEARAARLEENRQRTSQCREEESEEARAARLEKDRQRYHNEKAKAHEVEFDDYGVPKLCESVDIDGSVEKARELICRTAIDGDINKHQANVCVICDRIIQLGAKIQLLSEHKIKEHSDQLSVDSYNEFHGELHPEVVRQYQVDDMEGLLLSPRSRCTISPENGEKIFEVCSQCANGMRSSDKDRESPPGHAISNGFAIGSIPTKFAVKINGKLETFEVNDGMISALLAAAIAPVRPHAWIFSYTGGQNQKIRGNYQFFEANLAQMGGVFSHLNEHHINQILCVLSGAMTPKQKELARQQAEIDTKLYLGLLTWFIEESGHPAYENIPVPTECPRPIIIEDRESKHNTDEPSPDENGQKREETFEEGTCYFPTAGDPDSNTNVYKTSQEFAVSLLQNRSAPTMIASGGNYASHSEVLLENVRPIQFPYGNGGPTTRRRNPISDEECLKHYLQLSPSQFMRPEFVLLIRAMRDRSSSYDAVKFKCNNLSSQVGTDGKRIRLAEEISTMKEEDLVAALKEEEGRETGVAGRFLKAVSASCRALGHTAEAAKCARRKNFALQEYYGRHSFMLTASPCAENSFRIRLYADSGVMHELPSLNVTDEDCMLDLRLRQKRRLKYPGACAIEYQGAMKILLDALLQWDSANQVGRRGVCGILEAFSRADEEQGRGDLHGHWLLWIKEFGRLRNLLHDGDEKTKQCAKKELVKYLDMVMSSSYPDGFEVVHFYEGECLADGCDEKAVDGKHYCHTHLYLERVKDQFTDSEKQMFRYARHEDGCNKIEIKGEVIEIKGKIMTCKSCKENVVPREAAWAGLEQMGAKMGLSSFPTKLKGCHGEERARLDIATQRHVYDLGELSESSAESPTAPSNLDDGAAEKPEGVMDLMCGVVRSREGKVLVEDVPLEEDAEFLATILNPRNSRLPSLSRHVRQQATVPAGLGLENWRELLDNTFIGDLYGSKTIRDGTRHTTSRVTGKFGNSIKTDDGSYVLGQSLDDFMRIPCQTHEDKSFEELRLDNYLAGNKGTKCESNHTFSLPTLNNWKMKCDTVVGVIYGSKEAEDGAVHATSRVVGKIGNRVKTEDGSMYILGINQDDMLLQGEEAPERSDPWVCLCIEPVGDLQGELGELWDNFWNDPLVRRALLRIRYDEHMWQHVKGCFKKGCECRFFFPFLYSLVTKIYNDISKDTIKRYKLDGSDVIEVPRYGFQMKRHQGSQYMNTHSIPISDVLNCNTNVSSGDLAQLMYQTLYVSKCTQNDDSIPRQQVATRVIRSINRKEEMDRLNGVSESEPDFVEGLKRMLAAVNAATSRDTVSAPMAANLVHQKGTRFVFSHGFQPLLFSQMEDELEGRSNTEGKFIVRTCQTKSGSSKKWPDKSSNDYIYRNEGELKHMCLYQFTMHYEKSFTKKEHESGEEEEQTSKKKLRLEQDHPGHNFAYLKRRPRHVIPIIYLRRSKEDEEDAECEKFSSQFDNLDREEGAQPSESPSELPTAPPSGMQGQPSNSQPGQACDNDHEEGCDNSDGGTDVTEDERSPDEVPEEAFCLEARFCRLVELELVPDPTKLELESDNPSEKVKDNRERYAKLALMLFCPFTDLEELKINGSYWEKFDSARRQHFENKKQYPCFESLDNWRDQYVDGFWAKGFEILQHMEDNSAAMGAHGRTDTELTRTTNCMVVDGKKKKKRDLDQMKDFSEFFGDPDEDADANADAADDVDDTKYRFNHSKIIDSNVGTARLLNARLSSQDSIFLQDETADTKSQTKKKPSNKEADWWKRRDLNTKIKLIAGSVVGEFQDIYSSVVDSEDESTSQDGSEPDGAEETSSENPIKVPTLRTIAQKLAREKGMRLDKKQFKVYEIVSCSFLLSLIREENKDLGESMGEALGMDAGDSDFQQLIKALKARGGKEQLLMFLTGMAGAGKSSGMTVAQAFCFEFCKAVGIAWSENTFLFTAYTGSAASLFGGRTTSRATYTAKDLENITDEDIKAFEGVRILILDEISFMQDKELIKMDKALKKVGDRSKPFGGFNIVFAGDFMQLSPIHGGSKDQMWHPKSSRLFENNINSVVILDGMHRFKDDLRYGEALQRLCGGIYGGSGDFTEEDVEYINTRIIGSRTGLKLPKELRGDSCYATPNNAERNSISAGIFKEHLKQTHPLYSSEELPPDHTVMVEADVRPTGKGKDNDSKYRRMMRRVLELGDSCVRFNDTKFMDPCLRLYNGAYFICIDNDDLDKGPVESRRGNGTQCRVVSIKLKEDADRRIKIWDSQKVWTVSCKDVEYIEFEKLTGGRFKMTPSTRTVAVKDHGTQGKLKMTQFLVNSSDAVTGHKLQGMTKDNVIVVSWNKQINWIYVVLSRVRTLDGLYLFKRLKLKDIKKPESFKEFQAFMERMRRIEAKS